MLRHELCCRGSCVRFFWVRSDFRPTPQQEEHIEAVELRVPRLVAVRLELTPSYISENRFWKIYFVLLHSHLPPAASAVLSTPAVCPLTDRPLAGSLPFKCYSRAALLRILLFCCEHRFTDGKQLVDDALLCNLVGSAGC